ncbi:hypothetical protein ACFVHB_06410 [Kitasatospora sp. NPDC127111]|uniref:hypothetical protein n=1 Tax=Kitasatospora sp. NPDC127111 TaxID=3345363 RepID=UPI00363BAC12
MTDSRSTPPPERSSSAPGGGRVPRPDWGAVGALAGAVAAVVALVAYLVPPEQSAVTPVVTGAAPLPPGPVTPTSTGTPAPEPPPVTSPPAGSPPGSPTSDPVRSPSPSLTAEPVSTRPAVPSPEPPLPTIRPGGCDRAEAGLAAYRRNAGTTRGSQAAAASQARQDLMGAALDAQGAVGSTINRLSAEFQELSFRLTGMVGADPNQVIADINADSAQLKRLCGS